MMSGMVQMVAVPVAVLEVWWRSRVRCAAFRHLSVALMEFQREMGTRLDAIQQVCERESGYGGSHDDGHSSTGPVSGGEQCNDGPENAIPGCIYGERKPEVPPGHGGSPMAQHEWVKACICIQAWWRMRLVMCAVVHCINIKDINPPGRRRRTLDSVIDSGMYRRHLPVIHELFERLRLCFGSDKDRSAKRRGTKAFRERKACGSGVMMQGAATTAGGEPGRHLEHPAASNQARGGCECGE